MSLWHAPFERMISPSMNRAQNSHLEPAAPHRPASVPSLTKAAAAVLVAAALVLWSSPPLALIAGILFALALGQAPAGPALTKHLLQFCVVMLGFSMDLPVVLRLGLHGSLFAAATIVTTLALGYWLGSRLALAPRTTLLISAGTAICGGSAIAAVGSAIAASEAEIAVSIGTVFLLNALALYLFPLAGHLLHLSQPQFGLWAGIAIHNISSVVGAGLTYGPGSLATATAVKLSRTLWIAPLTLAIAIGLARRNAATAAENKSSEAKLAKVNIPWFVGLFLLASLLRSYVPGVSAWAPQAATIAHRGMVLVLFFVGTSLSVRSLRLVGWRTLAAGMTLWLFISATSLLAIRFLNLAQ